MHVYVIEDITHINSILKQLEVNKAFPSISIYKV